VFAKADGDRTFVLYLPVNPGPGTRSLRGVAADATYTATWHNPRTGDALPSFSLKALGSALSLPEAPDTEDWVLILRKAVP